MPQDMSHAASSPSCVIGDRNTIREFCTFNTRHAQGRGRHARRRRQLDHGLRATSRTTCASAPHGARQRRHAGGPRARGDWASIGGPDGVHQFVHVGAHAMIGFQSHVAQDVPPFFTAEGNPLALRALNLTGLKRRTSGRAHRRDQADARSLYRKGLTLEQREGEIEAMRTATPRATATSTDARLPRRRTRAASSGRRRWQKPSAPRGPRPAGVADDTCACAMVPARPPATCWRACCCRA
jgi:UDP-N-acetylglucosamine acyltransferase